MQGQSQEMDNMALNVDQDIARHLPPASPPLDPLPAVDNSLDDPLPALDAFDSIGNEATSAGQPSESGSTVFLPDETDEQTGEAQEAVHWMASRLTTQLCQFQGCCQSCHDQAETAHKQSFRAHKH